MSSENTQRIAAALVLIERAADNGRPAPSNDELCAALGANSPATGARCVQILEQRGLISVQRFHQSRQITITKTGRATFVKLGAKPHWRDTGAGRKARPARPVVLTEATPLPYPVHRDPCPRCGTRADVGCCHGWAP